MSFDKTCHHVTSMTVRMQSTPNFLNPSFGFLSSAQPQFLVTTNPFVILILFCTVLLFVRCYINEVIQYVVWSVWFLSFSIMLLKFTYVAVSFNSLFHFPAVTYPLTNWWSFRLFLVFACHDIWVQVFFFNEHTCLFFLHKYLE
jgi:hypothetical protein